jgi:cytochrome P450
MPKISSSNDYDPYEPAQAHDPYPIWRQAREACPVIWSNRLNAWVITRYEDVRDVITKPELFLSKDVVTPIAQPPSQVKALLARGFPQEELKPTVSRDGPSHAKLRRLLVSSLAPRYVSSLEPSIRATANHLIDAIESKGTADFVDTFAYRLPLETLLTLIGIEGASHDQIHKWTSGTLALYWGQLTLEDHLNAAEQYLEFQRYLHRLVMETRRQPKDNFLSRLVALAQHDELSLTDGELAGVLIGLVSAGHETTMNLLSLTLLNLLSPDRALWVSLCAQPEHIPDAIEESLRLNSPSYSLWRSAAANVEIAGVAISAGDRVTAVVGSANRDERVFEEPDETIFTRRSAVPHLAFGRGAHFCVGASLARLEAVVSFETLTSRMPSLRLSPTYVPSFRPNSVQRFLKHLEVAWDPT